MTDKQAKETLQLYRPGTADAEDPSFAEALALCERNVELKRWFEDHCALYSAFRGKFKQIAVPEGLKEQIISERKAHTVPLWQKTVLLAGAVALLALIVWQLRSFWPQPPERHDFAAYRSSMVSFAERGYGMDVYTNDLSQIRLILGQRNSITNYVLPANLQKNASVAGCAATTWQGKRVSMICFQTKPLPPTQSDLWLFVTDSSTAPDTPKNASPKFETANGTAIASWTVGGRTYVLATPSGDERFLAKFL